ncbi:hypothetical protein NLG97_g5644 [Lecanicillium saksenae]|uniref:Uncharacterized protein n=1 Tax=Lecanicillium saksenae TaxID=468837 RepID=A0ACC1QTR7_9HYPO|nr:hypothetical protein NLG97_g5644 [Lecanicillium saksenae]
MSPRVALFIIDVQNALASFPDSRVPHAERLITVLEEILDAVRSFPVPSNPRQTPPLIVFAQHSQPPEDGALVRGTEPWKLRFAPVQGNSNEMLVHKTTGDAFASNPTLASELRAAGVTHVITLGLLSECCVQETALGAFGAGFQVSILEGAHSTYNAGDATALEIEKEVEELVRSHGGQSMPYTAALDKWRAAGAVC